MAFNNTDNTNYRSVDFINKSYFQPMFLVLLLIVLVLFALRPTIKKSLTLRKEIKEYESLDKKLTDKILSLKDMRDKYNLVSDNIELIDEAIPDNTEEGKLLSQLNFLAAENNINLEDISFNYSNSQGLGEIKLNATLLGDYVNIQKFLTDLSNIIRIVVIDQIQFSPNDESYGSNSIVSIYFQGRAFYETE